MRGRVSVWLCAVCALAAGAARADVTISKQATSNMSCAAGVCSPTASNAVLNTTDLASMLASGDVKVTTGSGATSIIVKDTLGWASTSRLTLDANQSVIIDKPVTVTGTGAATITTNDGGTGGDLIFTGKGNVTFWDLSSSLIVNGSNYTLAGDIDTLASDIANNLTGSYALANDYRAKHAYHESPIPSFQGTFEGLGHVISKLTIKLSRRDAALFDEAGGSTFRDVGLEDVSITGSGKFAAALAVNDGNGGLVSGCYASGSITFGNASAIGGLVATDGTRATIRRSFANVDLVAVDARQHLDGDSPAVGGLVAYLNDSSVVQSYATGSVTGSDKTRVGGLVGSIQAGGVLDSYATGAVSGTASAHIGGLIGDMGFGSAVTTSFSTGGIIGGKKRTSGGFVGPASGAFTTNYWDVDTSGDDKGHGGGCGRECRDNITGLTTEQLTSALPTGFDPTVWGQNPTINGGYPYLLNNPPR